MFRSDPQSDKNFIIRLYRHILNREYDQEGFDYYLDFLNDTSDNSFLNQIYELFLERMPDDYGYNYYMNILTQTQDRKYVITDLLKSDEYNTLKTSMLDHSRDADFIISLYRNLLNRDPENIGFDYWYEQLSIGNLSRDQIIEQFLNSQEFNSVPNIYLVYGDVVKLKRYFVAKDFLESKEFSELVFKTDELFVNALFQKILDRKPDELGFNYYVSLLRDGKMTKRIVIEDFLHSLEYKTRAGSGYLYSLINDIFAEYDKHVSKQKSSYQIDSQVPEFVRQDHMSFVSFLEDYYKFLEQRDNTGNIAKNFTDYMDVDKAQGAFLQKLYENFISLIPEGVLADRKMILKHAKEFYRSRGSEKSVRYLMRILFNKDVDFYYPKKDILKTSDGKWYVEKSLKVSNLQVNNVSNNDITIWSYFINKRIVGATSNSYAVVERVEHYYDKGVPVTELKLSGVFRQFKEGETIYTQFNENGTFKTISANLYSGIITAVSIFKTGSGYSEGTTIPLKNETGSGAQLVISKTSRASLTGIIPIDRGAGFRVNDSIIISGGGGRDAAANVFLVFDDSYYHPNSYNFIASTIDLVANTTIDAEHYTNLNASLSYPYQYPIKDSMTFWTYANTGPVREIFIINPGTNYSTFPDTVKAVANSVVTSLGILGRMDIINGGRNYQIGDMIEFINPRGSFGTGAAGRVVTIDKENANAITRVEFVEVPGHIIGGSGYESTVLPKANVISATGTGAVINVTATLGGGDRYYVSENDLLGAIQEITIINPGFGYSEPPILDLTNYGDGTAQATATVISGAYSSPGRYLNDDGKLSSFKYIQDKDYYQDYSYVVKIDEPYNKWAKPFNELVHPAGMKVFSEYSSSDDLSKKLTIITSPNHHDYVLNKSTYTTTSIGLVDTKDVITNLTAFTIGSDAIDTDEYFVTYLYRHLLNRDPDQRGFDYYVDLLKTGQLNRDAVTISFLNSTEYNSIVASNEHYVTYVYSLLLDRRPDQRGFDYYTKLLNEKKIFRNDVLTSFLGSQEYNNIHSTNIDYVTSLFNRLLLREPDTGGLNYYVNILNTGGTRALVVEDFLKSSEYTTLHREPFDFIYSLYDTLFNRKPDIPGLMYYQDLIIFSGATNLDVIKDFVGSAEYKGTPRYDNVIYLSQWTANSNVWFDADGTYYAKIYNYQSRIVTADEKSATVVIDGMLPSGISNVPFSIIRKKNICNVTITKADHGYSVGDYADLQFLPNNSDQRFDIITQFVNSPEYYSIYGSSESSFVRSLYRNLLFREPDKVGFNYWVNQLNTGAQTRYQVTYDFIHSYEFLEFNYASIDLLRETDNGAFVSSLYQTYFNRKADDIGYEYWISQLSPVANNLTTGSFKVETVISPSQFVIYNNNTTNHTGNVMVYKV